jgi:hypothetical protein
MDAPFIQRTHFEILRYCAGKFVGSPLPCATLKEAKEEALHIGRGNLLDDKGNREPGIPVYELDGDEEPGPDADGLFIRRIVTRTEATVVF